MKTLLVSNLRVPIVPDNLRFFLAQRLEISTEDVVSVVILKSSVDARGRRPLRVLRVEVTVRDPEAVLRAHHGDRHVEASAPPTAKEFAGPLTTIGETPLVVGTGPAGLFLTLALLDKGYRPRIIERGKPLRPRWKDVNAYWRQGVLNPESNVVFGDGGAGTFSDGKLYTRRNDPRNTGILEVFADLADAPDILTAGKPHLGTNRLSRALLALHQRLEERGCRVEFETRLEELVIEGGRIRGAVVNGETMAAETVFLATGHSAHDVYRMLDGYGVVMEARPFAVGARAEHPQALINLAQLGTESPEEVEAADYMLSYNDKRGERSAYTFCMCPGGEVVGSSADPEGLTVNGMSYSHRADRFGNAAVVVTVHPKDFGSDHPLAGLDFQRRIERAAYLAGGGGHVAPAQRIEDFLAGRPSSGEIDTSYRTGVRAGDLIPLFPESVIAIMRRGLRHFGRRVRGYDGSEGVLIGAETRTSAPLRVLRDPETYQSVNVAGLYPVGEGAGYAGGIMSSASDGIRASERIAPRVKAD